MPRITHCSACSGKLRVPDELFGQFVKCPNCSQTFTTTEENSPYVPTAVAERVATPPPMSAPRTVPAADFQRGRPVPVLAPQSKPGQIQAMGVMFLAGGIIALVVGTALGLTCVGLFWPGTYLSLVLGILAVSRSITLLGDQAYSMAPPSGIAVLQIVNVINGDVPNCVMGIISLVFLLRDPKVRDYFRGM